METVKIRALAHEKPALDTKEVNEIVKDLIQPIQHIYWVDLAISCGLGWGSFAFYLNATTGFAQACFLVTAVICLYRGLFFIHEISHHSSKDLPGFSVAWNLLVGIPILAPSFLYASVHLDHHRRHKYGTSEDPEYLPLGKGSQLDIVIFLVKTILFPVALAVRALVLAPIGLLISPFHKWLETNLSALVINENYKRRDLSEFERSRMKITEIVTIAVWGTVISLYSNGTLPSDFFVHWYLLVFAIGMVNQVRTLVAHRYDNDGGELEYEEQLLDSVNVEGGFFTELWAPIGARYHALHHYIPKLPYHSLPEAHRRMKDRFGENSLYQRVNEVSFLTAFRKLWKVIALVCFLSAASPTEVLAMQGDPCIERIASSLQKQENISLVKSGLKNIEAVAESVEEIDKNSYAGTDEQPMFGRFFKVESKSKKILFWMMPYAAGKACVLRDIKNI